MSQLLETIKCSDGKLYNLDFHQARFNKVRKEYFGLSDEIKLKEIIEISEKAKNGLFRCRILYAEKIEKIEFIPHQFRKIESLKLVESDSINYHFKFANRKKLNQLFEKRGNCDDILIVKNNCITDSLTANPIFFDGEKWWTSDTPLLPGTQRARLIRQNKIFVCRITTDDLRNYEKVGLINAMWNLENMPQVRIENLQ